MQPVTYKAREHTRLHSISKAEDGSEISAETNRPDAFEAFLEPHAYGLLGDLLFDGVLQLFPGQQLLQLERLPNVH